MKRTEKLRMEREHRGVGRKTLCFLIFQNDRSVDDSTDDFNFAE